MHAAGALPASRSLPMQLHCKHTTLDTHKHPWTQCTSRQKQRRRPPPRLAARPAGSKSPSKTAGAGPSLLLALLGLLPAGGAGRRARRALAACVLRWDGGVGAAGASVGLASSVVAVSLWLGCCRASSRVASGRRRRQGAAKTSRPQSKQSRRPAEPLYEQHPGLSGKLWGERHSTRKGAPGASSNQPITDRGAGASGGSRPRRRPRPRPRRPRLHLRPRRLLMFYVWVGLKRWCVRALAALKRFPAEKLRARGFLRRLGYLQARGRSPMYMPPSSSSRASPVYQPTALGIWGGGGGVGYESEAVD